MKVLHNLSLADLLLGNDLFSADSKLGDPIEIVHFDVYQSPVMDSASSSESVSRQLSETSCASVDNQMSVSPSELDVEYVELAISSDHIVEYGVMMLESEMVTTSSDPIEITAVTR